MPTPVITPLPPAPTPADAPDVFANKAGAFVTAEVLMVPELNTSFTWMAATMATTEGYKTAAAQSATNAADSATLAGQQVGLAADQVGLAAQQVTLAGQARQGAEVAESQAQIFAAAAQSAAGLPSLAGNAGKVLGVNAAANAVGWVFGLPDVTAKSGYTLQVNAAGNNPQWVKLGLMHVVDERAGGTGSPDTLPNSSYGQRSLNTVKANTITGASLSSSAITLPAGEYKIRASAPAFSSIAHKARLYNVTSGVVLAVGTSEFSANPNSSQGQTRSFIFTSLILTVPAVLRLEHRCSGGNQNGGSQTSFGDVEVYSEVIIEQVR